MLIVNWNIREARVQNCYCILSDSLLLKALAIYILLYFIKEVESWSGDLLTAVYLITLECNSGNFNRYAQLYLGDVLSRCDGSDSYTDVLCVRGSHSNSACGVLAVRVAGLQALKNLW